MAREKPMLALGLLAVCTGVIVLMLAFVFVWHLDGSTPSAMADTAKGQRIAIPAVVAFVTGVVALSERRRRWAFVVGWVGVAAAVVAVLLTVLLHGGSLD